MYLECYVCHISIYRRCWFSITKTKNFTYLWGHSLSPWTQRWSLAVRHVCTCGKSPRLHEPSVTHSPARWATMITGVTQTKTTFLVQRDGTDYATCPSAFLLCLRAICQAMPCSKRTRIVSHFHKPLSACFLPSCWPTGFEAFKAYQSISATNAECQSKYSKRVNWGWWLAVCWAILSGF